MFEREDRIGGLLRYGIPDFKLEKSVVQRRVKIMEGEGITFKTNAFIGKDIPVSDLENEFDAVVICAGSTKPRDLPIPGRDANGSSESRAVSRERERGRRRSEATRTQ